MQEYESAKQRFSLQDSPKVYDLQLASPDLYASRSPDVQGYDSDQELVLLSKADLQAFFDPVIDQITELVRTQVRDVGNRGRSRIQTLLPLGEFGDSLYLKANLSTWCVENSIRRATPHSGG
jgi:hypothetical protein